MQQDSPVVGAARWSMDTPGVVNQDEALPSSGTEAPASWLDGRPQRTELPRVVCGLCTWLGETRDPGACPARWLQGMPLPTRNLGSESQRRKYPAPVSNPGFRAGSSGCSKSIVTGRGHHHCMSDLSKYTQYDTSGSDAELRAALADLITKHQLDSGRGGRALTAAAVVRWEYPDDAEPDRFIIGTGDRPTNADMFTRCRPAAVLPHWPGPWSRGWRRSDSSRPSPARVRASSPARSVITVRMSR